MLAWLLALIIPFVLPLLDTPVVHAPSSRPTLFQAASHRKETLNPTFLHPTCFKPISSATK